MRHLLHAVKLTDLVERVNAGGKTAMQAEDLALNDCSQREEVKKLGEELPDISVSVLSQAFVVEAVAKRL